MCKRSGHTLFTLYTICCTCNKALLLMQQGSIAHAIRLYCSCNKALLLMQQGSIAHATRLYCSCNKARSCNKALLLMQQGYCSLTVEILLSGGSPPKEALCEITGGSGEILACYANVFLPGLFCELHLRFYVWSKCFSTLTCCTP
jgi:hypothetical protein